MEDDLVRFIIEDRVLDVDREVVMRNDVMRVMLQSGMRESFEDIRVDDCSYPCFSLFIEFLGRGMNLTANDFNHMIKSDNLFGVLEICRRYNETKIFGLCDYWVSKESRFYNLEDVYKYLNLGLEYGLEKTIEVCLAKCIKTNSTSVLREGLKASKTVFEYLISVYNPASIIEFLVSETMLTKDYVFLIDQYGMAPLDVIKSKNEPLRMIASWILGKDLSLKNEFLLWAGEKMNLELICLLIDHGADVNYFRNGDSLIHISAQRGGVKSMRYLVDNGADTNLQNSMGEYPIHKAIDRNSLEMLTCLVNNGADTNVQNSKGEYPIHMAIDRNSLEMLTCLVDNGADTNVQDSMGEYPIHKAIDRKSLEMLTCLVNNGADTNLQNSMGEYPIHKAIDRNSLEMLTCLVNNGADTNLQDSKVEYPIHMAIDRNSLEMLTCLVNNGADTNVQNSKVEYPIHMAIDQKSLEMLTCLVNNGADTNVQNSKVDYPIHMAIDYSEGNYPIHRACASGNLAMVKYLSEHGADPSLVNRSDSTAYWIACNNLKQKKTKEYEEIVDILESSQCTIM